MCCLNYVHVGTLDVPSGLGGVRLDAVLLPIDAVGDPNMGAVGGRVGHVAPGGHELPKVLLVFREIFHVFGLHFGKNICQKGADVAVVVLDECVEGLVVVGAAGDQLSNQLFVVYGLVLVREGVHLGLDGRLDGLRQFAGLGGPLDVLGRRLDLEDPLGGGVVW